MVVETRRSGGGTELVLKVVLGIGYWVQGLRCFPWMAVNFFLKDGLNVDPSTLQILQNLVNLPMVAKPLYGVVSDAFYIGGQHRLPYIALGGKCLGSVCSSSIYILLVSMKKYVDAALEFRVKVKL